MPLQDYRRKRDFKKTPEPGPKVAKTGKTLSFVVQKHDATRLHYDFRLELDGVLKSWAVPKGPSLDPGVKSLAVEVEDHPVAYGGFEGIIPQGEYGGGTVIVWDNGTWEPENDPHEGLRKGDLKFTLHGHKLKGSWVLVRLRAREGEEGKKNWLLIKHKDKFAKPGDEHGITDQKTKSVLTRRTIQQVADDPGRVWTRTGERKMTKAKGRAKAKAAVRSKAPAKAKSAARKTKTVKSQHRRVAPDPSTVDAAETPGATASAMPRGIKPELATLASTVPAGDKWIHEIKFDGYRIIAYIGDGHVRLMTRAGKDWTERFPDLASKLEELPVQSAIIDGELVALDEQGISRFQRMQNALSEGRESELIYYGFDLVHLDGYDLRPAALIDRKAALKDVLLAGNPGNTGTVRYSDHIEGKGEEIFQIACKTSQEGIICKLAASLYEERRSGSWLKVKCHQRQEFIICGYSKPERSRIGFGALMLGYYDGPDLVYCGRVGTGFDVETLNSLAKRLKPMALKSHLFQRPPTAAERRGVTWVRPELVAEVEFTEWTDDGVLRHPSFQGLREDKPAKEVVRERPRTAGQAVENDPMAKKASAKKRSTSKPASAKPNAETSGAVAGVTLTHPERVLYADAGITKLDLARYYEAVADWVLPYVINRPLTLVRCPDGAAGQCFYQKHWTPSLPKAVGFEKIKEKSATEPYVVIKDLAGLISLVQISVLELHPWGSRIDKLENPEHIVLDLDPGPGVDWKTVIQAAREIRGILEDLDLEAFVRTSGGKGLHVVVPLSRRNAWDEVETFAHNIAAGLALHGGERYVANMRKELRKGKTYVDYLRNQRGSTAVASYSSRNRPGAPVATPISWDELGKVKSADQFTIESVPARLAKLKTDPWKDFSATKQSLTAEIRSRADDFAKSHR
jgi:bifunctional non-homologous end joining protein LigD